MKNKNIIIFQRICKIVIFLFFFFFCTILNIIFPPRPFINRTYFASSISQTNPRQKTTPLLLSLSLHLPIRGKTNEFGDEKITQRAGAQRSIKLMKRHNSIPSLSSIPSSKPNKISPDARCFNEIKLSPLENR